MLNDENLYNMIFKRKSFHLFRNIGNLSFTQDELKKIEEKYNSLIPLYSDIKTKIKIVPTKEINFSVGQEYCILFYSEKKKNYQQNIGYLGEQLDLYLVSQNIATLWLGLGKTKQSAFEGLDFVIMMGISKVDNPERFRKNFDKCKRKDIEKIWSGEQITGFTDLIRYAPSACNIQPWFVDRENNIITIYRYKIPGIRGLIPELLVSHYNQIDIGIFICYVELCLSHLKIECERKLFDDLGKDDIKTLIAKYEIL